MTDLDQKITRALASHRAALLASMIGRSDARITAQNETQRQADLRSAIAADGSARYGVARVSGASMPAPVHVYNMRTCGPAGQACACGPVDSDAYHATHTGRKTADAYHGAPVPSIAAQRPATSATALIRQTEAVTIRPTDPDYVDSTTPYAEYHFEALGYRNVDKSTRPAKVKGTRKVLARKPAPVDPVKYRASNGPEDTKAHVKRNATVWQERSISPHNVCWLPICPKGCNAV